MKNIIDKMLVDLESNMNKDDVQYFVYGLPNIQVYKEMLRKGAIFIKPVTSSITPITTGITDEGQNEIDIVLAKDMQIKVYRDPKQETGDKFLNRVMDGREADGSPKTNTIRYIIRNNLQKYGVLQPSVAITYDDNRIDSMATVTATMTVSQFEHYSQAI